MNNKLLVRTTLLIGLGVSALGLPGCIIVSKHEEPPTVALPEGKYTGAIRAAQAISFSQERSDALKNVASKPDLEEVDQHRLVYILRRDDGFSSAKTDVAVALIENPNCTVATRNMIGSYAKDIASFSSDRSRLAAALAR